MNANATLTTSAVLVAADWALEHLEDSTVRFVEVDVDTDAYGLGHIPGAVGWNWTSQLTDGLPRDIAGRADFGRLLPEPGIGPEPTIVLYAANNNCFPPSPSFQPQL